ncbi:MAG: divalent-cation tolerance protein CutA [Planctomycetota bacterium]
MGSPRIVLTTAPDRETGTAIARALVERALVACANLLPGARSIYRWEGRIEESDEILIVLKTSAERIGELEQALSELHPYEVPEFVVVAPSHVGAKYLSWLLSETSGGSEGPQGIPRSSR